MSKSNNSTALAEGAEATKSQPTVTHAEPAKGGSFVRDLETGALIPAAAPTNEKPPKE